MLGSFEALEDVQRRCEELVIPVVRFSATVVPCIRPRPMSVAFEIAQSFPPERREQRSLNCVTGIVCGLASPQGVSTRLLSACGRDEPAR